MKNTVAWIDDIHKLSVIGDTNHLLKQEANPVIYWERKNCYFETKIDQVISDTKLTIKYNYELPMGEELNLIWGEYEIPIYPGAIVRTLWFDEQYANEEAVLGAICSKTSTTFSIWSPTATSINVFVGHHRFPLVRKRKGLWQLHLEGDWHGYSYIYEVTLNGETQLVNDPYAKSMLANSSKGVIIDFNRTKDLKQNSTPRPKMDSLQDTIIYELHVRDATIHPNSGVSNKGKYLGLSEKNTTTSNGYSTALSYIKSLGVTHVQLLPINDFARVDETSPELSYNWGYDPLFYQVPEGSYSIIPDNPVSRINECKTMIDTFHQEGIGVILDVVYNHVFIMEESPFEKLVPGYYFRYHLDGSVSNGTGVGNDIASERKMVRKFILDSINFWLEEYQVDGFRFDLMGIHDIETMKRIQTRCQKEPVPIMLLGEGWDLPTALPSNLKATNSHSDQIKGISFFNDFFRDSMKGNLFHTDDVGYINGNGHYVERLPHLVTGSVLEEYGHPFVTNVSQTINYVECHDNHTLWDRLKLTNSNMDEEKQKRMHQLATGLTLLSQGIPFIHAGQEWFRSKQGDENSYISGDEINQLDWDKREKEDPNISFVQSLIALRKSDGVFRLQSKEEIRRRFHVIETVHPIFGYTLLGDDIDYSIYINPTNDEVPLRLPSSGKWKVAISNISNPNESIIGEFTTIKAFEFLVLKKSRKIVELETVSTTGSQIQP